MGPAENLQTVRNACRMLTITVVAEDTIDGRKMYVLEGTRNMDAVRTTSTKLWLDQESLLVRRQTNTIVSKVKPDEPRTLIDTEDFLNIKLNQPLDPKLFEYTPPAGALVTDNTQPKP